MSCKHLLLLLCFASVVGFACGRSPDASSTLPADRWTLVDQETWRDTLRLSLFIDDSILTPGELLSVRAVVENVSAAPVAYTVLRSPVRPSRVPIRIWLEHPFGVATQLTSPQDPGPRQASPGGFGNLNSGETLIREVQWRQALGTGYHLEYPPIPAPKGTYTIKAQFFPGIQKPESPEEAVTLSHEVSVKGDVRFIPEDEAIAKALALPVIQQWLQENTGEARAREEGGQYYGRLGEEWRPMDKATYDLMHGYETTPVLEYGWWRVEFKSTAPHGGARQMYVVLDAETGEHIGPWGDLPPKRFTDPVGQVPWRLVGEATWQDALKMSLFVSSDTIRIGERLDVRVRVENTSTKETFYTMMNIGDPPVYMWIDHSYGESAQLWAPEDARILLALVTSGSLKPGEFLERRVWWYPALRWAEGPVPAPNGTYIVVASLLPGKYDYPFPEEPLRLSHPIHVTGSIDLLTEREALQKALEIPALQRWSDAHSGEALTKRQGGWGYTLTLVPKSGEIGERLQWLRDSSTNQERYESLSKFRPTPAMSLSAGWWTASLRMGDKTGFPPYEIVARLDGRTGSVLSMAPDLDAELAGGVVATFQVATQDFHAFTTNPEVIESLLRLQRGKGAALIPTGALLPGHGPGLHNPSWAWHLDPQDFRLVSVADPSCDSTPESVHRDVEHWLVIVGRFCPATAMLTGITDYR